MEIGGKQKQPSTQKQVTRHCRQITKNRVEYLCLDMTSYKYAAPLVRLRRLFTSSLLSLTCSSFFVSVLLWPRSQFVSVCLAASFIAVCRSTTNRACSDHRVSAACVSAACVFTARALVEYMNAYACARVMNTWKTYHTQVQRFLCACGARFRSACPNSHPVSYFATSTSYKYLELNTKRGILFDISYQRSH